MLNYCQKDKLLVLVISVLLTACDPPVQEHRTPQSDPVAEQLVRANQYMQRRHQDHISAFVERVGWEAEMTSSGLWIVLEIPGQGKRITENSRISYSFKSMLLDGTPCYNATEQDPKEIIIGKGGVESGVEQGMLLLRQGAEAIFIIPPHLAHGNFGDRDRIPGNSILICRVKVLAVQ
ncbi:MAG: FKBP-type peptidyl-prolyl cis-trans isomerase [Bacteroidales bacterium]|nr:FKBP-type peptidyl-prolyl cis-trans isomerase [Bacteroidales bacterium]